MTLTVTPSLDSIPQEVLEHIAFYTATDNFLGPPAALVPLLSSSRKIHSRLSIAHNHHLYAAIFAYKFDLQPAIRRLGADRITPGLLAAELKRRCGHLRRIRGYVDALVVGEEMKGSRSLGDRGRSHMLGDVLLQAYVLILENEGKNEAQLRHYARLGEWLQRYWFDERGASTALACIQEGNWPPNDDLNSIAMWLFWFLLKPADYPRGCEMLGKAASVLKVFALAAHKYELASPSWVDFIPESRPRDPQYITHYEQPCQLFVPPLATPAILSYLTLISLVADKVGCQTPVAPSTATCRSKQPQQSREWECEWGRSLSLAQDEYDRVPSDSFRPGSIQGVWEGMFTYTEFTIYAALLRGDPPPTLHRGIVVQHRQTWKLREHHLMSASDSTRSDFGTEMGRGADIEAISPLPPGDPLRSYFPTGTSILEHRNGIEVRRPGTKEVLHYQRAPPLSLAWSTSCGDETNRKYVRDIIITGEGHSAWGQFNLVGRVRPCDGFVSLSKEYVDGDRGTWLYRGYLVGNANGNLAGRWRDTLSPANMPGYEGCFTMSRRR
ncbi:hypothetical protein BDN72DRAFT_817787 [Pluteus cervinus]|uniref:Uncharacterized protein n=1 Tax=Pluteus cervinus TaxID=181527 RepID=A0ACD3B0M8_9AGAR|nr:hypothetical protein BDN72DRAFT_817787 [Pluteus cervinus]